MIRQVENYLWVKILQKNYFYKIKLNLFLTLIFPRAHSIGKLSRNKVLVSSLLLEKIKNALFCYTTFLLPTNPNMCPLH